MIDADFTDSSYVCELRKTTVCKVMESLRCCPYLDILTLVEMILLSILWNGWHKTSRKMKTLNSSKTSKHCKDLQKLQRKQKGSCPTLSQTSTSLPFITATADDPKHIETILTLPKFEELCSNLHDRCRTLVENAL